MNLEQVKAKEIFSSFYVKLLDVDSEISNEILISILSKDLAIILCNSHIKEYNDEIIFCGYDADFEMWKDKRDNWIKVKNTLEDEY